ncbi:MAG TPA: HlyD family efflux transporter periplasmic adaptor subunit [Gemmatimonadaceae bacterium]|nr:HlyD family efflux transporter periplasmic adaptor subunit [Gemmatimonadaceae bacterium]
MDIPREQKPNRRKYVYASAAVLGLVFVTVALGRLEPAAPSVDRAVLWIDTVKQGTIPREVRASGTLVPESITWIPAVTGGRIEQIHARPGAAVSAETIILELTNPDVQLEALSAQQQLEQAQAQLSTLENELETQRLNQEAAVATASTTHNEAKRNEIVFLSLDSQKLASVNEVQAAKERAVEAAKRLQIEEERLRLHNASAPVRISQQKQQIERLRSIAQFQQNRIASMKVRAGVSGVLQEMTWEPGQWVNSGQILAKVSEPGRLKAVLRVQENQARDVVVGLDVKVDPRLDSRAGTIPGRVMRIDPASVSGSVLVEVQLLASELPRGARPDLSVDGIIEIDRLEDVKYVGRPLIGQPDATVGLFRLDPDGRYATRANVKFGRASVNTIEILQGLDVGDRVIISDMSQYDNADRVRVR